MKTQFKRRSSCVLQMKQGMWMLLEFLLKIFQECTVSPHRKNRDFPARTWWYQLSPQWYLVKHLWKQTFHHMYSSHLWHLFRIQQVEISYFAFTYRFQTKLINNCAPECKLCVVAVSANSKDAGLWVTWFLTKFKYFLFQVDNLKPRLLEYYFKNLEIQEKKIKKPKVLHHHLGHEKEAI